MDLAFTIGVATGAVGGVVVMALGFALLRRIRGTGRHRATSHPGQPGELRATTGTTASSDLARTTPPASPDPARTDPVSSADPAQTSPPQADPPSTVLEGSAVLDGIAKASLDALRVGVLVLDPDCEVTYANPTAGSLGLIDPDSGGVAHSVLRSLATRVRRSGENRDAELELPRSSGREPRSVRVWAVPLAGGHVAIEVEDTTEAQRVALVRRDFVANVSHELKTPVGALQLLSEALVDAGDDLEAAGRFSERILHESNRLGRLVTELLELSRLQGGEPLPDPELVSLDRIVNEVLDRSRTAASAKEITLTVAGRRGLKLYGHEHLLVTALSNLVDNAIAYSPENTTVTIAPDRTGERVEIAVTDEGMGIAVKDQARIFERFYRADPARSRATGGTGLGLAIVKHIATNHGGRVSVRSAVGEGSTFTLRLPVRPPGATPRRDPESTRRNQGSADPVTADARQ